MEFNRINIYINEHLWNYFEDDERVPIFLVINDEQIGLVTSQPFKEACQFVKYMKSPQRGDSNIKMNDTYFLENWKMLSIFPNPKIFENVNKVGYYLYTEAWRTSGRYQNEIRFDYSKPCFGSLGNSICCYSETADLFAEFYFLPKVWYENNSHMWPEEFQKDVENVKRYLNYQKDIQFSIIQALGRLYKSFS